MAQIRPLPTEIATQIKASANICSLNDVVRSLLENSLDANATKVTIKIDYSKGSCWVQDNGFGIAQADFEETGGLGKPYHSSNIDGDVKRLGKNGCFLSSVSALCVLTITSRQEKTWNTNALMLHYGRSPLRFIPAPEHLSIEILGPGTKVGVHDLFGNMPVRVKQRPVDEKGRAVRDKEWSILFRLLIGVLLAWRRPISLSLRGVDSGHVFTVNSKSVTYTPFTSKINIELTKSLLRQGLGLDTSADWIQVSARTTNIAIRALVSIVPCPDRKSQFLCLGSRYMPPGGIYEPLYEAINRIFFNSSFGAMENSPSKGRSDLVSPIRRLRGSRKGLDRWPMFVLYIDHTEPCNLDYDSNFATAAVEITSSMMTSFLTEHNLQPRLSSRLSHAAQKVSRKADKSVNTQPRKSFGVSDHKSMTCKPIERFQDTVSDLAGCSIRFPVMKSGQVEIAGKEDIAFRSRFLCSRNDRFLSRHSIASSPADNNRLPEPEDVVPGPVSLSIRPTEGIAKRLAPFTGDKTETAMQEIAILSMPVPGKQDEYVDWIDPMTKQTLRINARTGCATYEEGKQRPTTGSSISQTSSIASRTLKSLPRLIRVSHGVASPKEGSWAKHVLTSWQNPVFETAEDQIHSLQFDAPILKNLSANRHSCVSNSGPLDDNLNGRALKISRIALQRATVISQVDSKFVLIRTRDTDQELIVLIDQHASDERIKLERLLQELCSPLDPSVDTCVSPLGYKSPINTVILDSPMFFELQYHEHDLFNKAAKRLAQWGILYDLATSSGDRILEAHNRACRLVVLSLPAVIAQRCRLEPATLIHILRDEAYQYNESKCVSAIDISAGCDGGWVQRVHSCPQGILDLLNSRACRSAIMFNDDLSLDQCRNLVADLAKCKFPFQCAHARPTMVPVLRLEEDSITEKCLTVERKLAADLQHWLDGH